ncbi:MAG: GTPase ObgE, partial [Candidatus Thiodiazotropha taylori]
DESVESASEVRQIEQEMSRYSEELAGKERWLVLNKKDLLLDEEFQERSQALVDSLGWSGPGYGISAVSGEGTKQLVSELMLRLEQLWQSEQEPEQQQDDDEAWDPLQ